MGGREGEADELAGGSQSGGTAGINDLGDFLTVAAAPEHSGGVTSRWKQTGAKGDAGAQNSRGEGKMRAVMRAEAGLMVFRHCSHGCNPWHDGGSIARNDMLASFQ